MKQAARAHPCEQRSWARLGRDELRFEQLPPHASFQIALRERFAAPKDAGGNITGWTTRSISRCHCSAVKQWAGMQTPPCSPAPLPGDWGVPGVTPLSSRRTGRPLGAHGTRNKGSWQGAATPDANLPPAPFHPLCVSLKISWQRKFLLRGGCSPPREGLPALPRCKNNPPAELLYRTRCPH